MADLSSALEFGRSEYQTGQIAHMSRNLEQGGLSPRQLSHFTIGDKHHILCDKLQGPGVWSVGRRTLTGAMHITYPPGPTAVHLRMNPSLTQSESGGRWADLTTESPASSFPLVCALRMPQVLVTRFDFGTGAL